MRILLPYSALLAFAAASNKLHINPDSRLMEDEHNRTTILHGVNVVYKVHPYIPDRNTFHPQDSLTDDEIDQLVDWGFNFVRLGVMWEAVETAPGVYNSTYLDECNELITAMGDKGIYTLVDAHQDVFARSICGEGVPNFYATDELLSHSCDDNLIEDAAWLVGACKSIKDYGFRYD